MTVIRPGEDTKDYDYDTYLEGTEEYRKQEAEKFEKEYEKRIKTPKTKNPKIKREESGFGNYDRVDKDYKTRAWISKQTEAQRDLYGLQLKGLKSIDEEEYNKAEKERPVWKEGETSYDDYAKSLSEWSNKYANVLGRGEERYEKESQFLEEKKTFLDKIDKKQFEEAESSKPIYKKDVKIQKNNVYGDPSEYSEALNKWVKNYGNVYGRKEDRYEQINKDLKYQVGNGLEKYGVGKNIEALKQSLAKWTVKQVDDIRKEKRYYIFGRTRGDALGRQLSGYYKSEKEAKANLKDWGYGATIKEATVNVNYGKKGIKNIEGEGDYVIKYRKDGTIEKITARPKVLEYQSGYSKDKPRTGKLEYIPYEAIFDEKGNLVAEKTYKPEKIKDSWDRDWGSKADYDIKLDTEITYKDGKPVELKDYDIYKKSVDSSKGWAYTNYGDYTKEHLKFDNGLLKYKEIYAPYKSDSLISDKKSSEGKQYSSVDQSYGIYLDKAFNFTEGKILDYVAPKGRKEYIVSKEILEDRRQQQQEREAERLIEDSGQEGLITVQQVLDDLELKNKLNISIGGYGYDEYGRKKTQIDWYNPITGKGGNAFGNRFITGKVNELTQISRTPSGSQRQYAKEFNKEVLPEFFTDPTKKNKGNVILNPDTGRWQKWNTDDRGRVIQTQNELENYWARKLSASRRTQETKSMVDSVKKSQQPLPIFGQNMNMSIMPQTQQQQISANNFFGQSNESIVKNKTDKIKKLIW